MRLLVSIAISTLGFPAGDAVDGEFTRLRNSSGSSCAAASRGETSRPSRATPKNPRRFVCVVMAWMSPALLTDTDHGSGERLSGGLHGGLARAAVLFILTALSGIAAFDLCRVGA